MTVDLLNGRLHTSPQASGSRIWSADRLICTEVLQHSTSNQIEALPKKFRFLKICASSASSETKQALVEDYSRAPLTYDDMTDDKWVVKMQQLHLALLGAAHLHDCVDPIPPE